MDYFTRAFSERHQIRFRMVDVSETAVHLAQLQQLSLPAEIVLAESLMAAAFQIADLMQSDAVISVQLKTRGLFEKVLAEATALGDLRGFVGGKYQDKIADKNATETASALGQKGDLFIFQSARKQVLSSHKFPLIPPRIRVGFSEFWQKTRGKVPVMQWSIMAAPGAEHHARGLLIEPIEGNTTELGATLIETMEKQTTLTSLQQAKGIHFVKEALGIQDLHVVEHTDLQFKCQCSMENAKREVMEQSMNQLFLALEASNPKTITCPFCNNRYTISLDELQRMINRKV